MVNGKTVDFAMVNHVEIQYQGALSDIPQKGMNSKL